MDATKPVGSASRPMYHLAGLLVLLPIALVIAERKTSLVSTICHPETFSLACRKERALASNLETQDLAILQRIELKETLIRQLIAGQTSLAEVTQQFLEINQSSVDSMTEIRANYEGNTDEEKTARNVISFAAYELSHTDPATQVAVLVRLESELESLVGRCQADQR